MDNGSYVLLPIVALVVIFFVVFISAMRRYKRCPSDKLLVIYGKTGRDAGAVAISLVSTRQVISELLISVVGF